MTWGAQVRQVFVKDVGMLWKHLLGVAVLAVAATVRALGGFPELGIPLFTIDMAMCLVVFMTMLSAAVLDPPAVSTAFWATQPLRPSAVAAAKLAVLATVLAMLAAGALVTTTVWHASLRETLSTLWHLATVVLVFGLGGATVGAIGGSRKSAMPYYGVFTNVCTVGFWVVMGIWRTGSDAVHRAIDGIPDLASLPLMIGALCLFMRLYRQREHDRRLRVVSMAAVLIPGVWLLRNPPAPRGDAAGAGDPSSLTLQALWDNATADRLELAVTAQGDDGRLMRVLEDAHVTAILRDGNRIPFEIGQQRLTRVDGQVPVVVPRGRAAQIIGAAAQRASTPYTSFWVWTREEQPRLLHGVVRFELEGRLDDYQVIEADRFALRSDGVVARDGRIARVTTTPRKSGPLITFDLQWLLTPARRAAWAMPQPLQHYLTLNQTFSALNVAADSLLPLQRVDCDGKHPFTDISLALPGFGTADYTCALKPAVWSAIRPPVSTAWIDESYLLVGEPVLKRSTRVRAVAIVPGEPE